MLLNFSRKYLETSVTCSTVSNDGFEVTNLTSDSEKGFLAYSCIKPPVHIDFSLICDVRINHILVWPSVGAQKSSGFEISVKTGNGYKRVSVGFLETKHCGVLFYRTDGDGTDPPPNFLRRYMRRDPCLDRVKYLRVSILKTDNSVPAMGRIEIWGRAAASGSNKTIERLYNLWRNGDKQITTVKTTEPGRPKTEKISGDSREAETKVPECFLDPITCSVMIQPIVLPSGAIIDQSTLEKHGKVEATWGRPMSDPFTGIPFSDSRKPIIASALKARIDKYLVENANSSEVKKLPRLSGHRQVPSSTRNRQLEMAEIGAESNLGSVAFRERNDVSGASILNGVIMTPAQSKIQSETRAHKLPVMAACFKRNSTKIRLKTSKLKNGGLAVLGREIRPMENRNENCRDISIIDGTLNLQRFDETPGRDRRRNKCLESCKCLSQIFYKLPCDHILCRDVLMAIEDSRCADCSSFYNSRDLERIHGHLTA